MLPVVLNLFCAALFVPFFFLIPRLLFFQIPILSNHLDFDNFGCFTNCVFAFLFSWTFSFLDSKLANKELAFVYRLPLRPAFGSSLICNPHSMTLSASQCLQTLINLKNKPHKVKSLSDYSELFRMDFDKCLYHFSLRMFTCREAKPEACAGKQFQHTHRICMISIFTNPDACSQNKPSHESKSAQALTSMHDYN